MKKQIWPITMVSARWYALSPQQQDAIASPGAWLTTAASRICLDLLGSARARPSGAGTGSGGPSGRAG